eukprot:9466475-Pyramimonas_sp.AAC.1
MRRSKFGKKRLLGDRWTLRLSAGLRPSASCAGRTPHTHSNEIAGNTSTRASEPTSARSSWTTCTSDSRGRRTPSRPTSSGQPFPYSSGRDLLAHSTPRGHARRRRDFEGAEVR